MTTDKHDNIFQGFKHKKINLFNKNIFKKKNTNKYYGRKQYLKKEREKGFLRLSPDFSHAFSQHSLTLVLSHFEIGGNVRRQEVNSLGIFA